MRKMKKVLTFFITLAFCVGLLSVPAFAAESQQDGLKVELKTDQSEYKTDDDISVTLKVTNTTEKTISNVSMENLVPDGYKLAPENQASKTIDEIGAGESIVLKTTFTSENAQMAGTGSQGNSGKKNKSGNNGNKETVATGDQNNICVWGIVCVLAICFVIGTLACKKHHARKYLSLLLVTALVGMTANGLSVKAAATQKSINLSEQVKVGSKEVSLAAIVTYDLEENQQPTDGDTTKVTREEWILALADAIGLEGVSDEQHSYDDFADAESPDIIEAAFRLGIVTIEPDEDNMVYFHPDSNATREFAAYTAIHALNYQLDEDVSAEWVDFSEIEHPQEVVKSVEAEIFQVTDNCFNPKQELTQLEKKSALEKIKEITRKISGDGKGKVEYVDGVESTTLTYTLDESNKTITTENASKTKGWAIGEVHALFSKDGLEKDIAIKITNITKSNGTVTIQYEEPALSEVVKSFEMEGIEDTEGEFIPAEGVTVVDEETPVAMYSSRATTHGSLALFGKKNISFKAGNLNCSGSIDIKNLEYRFAASPSWHLITINDAYLALNTSLDCNIDYNEKINQDLNQKIKLGTFKCPFGHGFNGSGDIYLVVSAKGGLSVGVELASKCGLQYSNNAGLRPVYQLDHRVKGLALKGNFKGGIAAECSAEFLGIDLITVGAQSGLAMDGKAENIQLSPLQFCIDGKLYIYLGIYGRVGWDELNIRYDREILNSDNSIYKQEVHFEETGQVDKCTRGSGTYNGCVLDAQTNQPIKNAKIQMVKNGTIKDTTYTEHTGKYTGINLSSGKYKLRVSAQGYQPSELDVTIVGGTSTTIPTQLLVKRGSEQEGTVLCSGTVTNAVTGAGLEGVKVSAKSQNLGAVEEIASTITDETGQYELSLPSGKYKLTFTKDGYVSNYSNVTVFEETRDVCISLNPENQIVADSFRVVLHWGNTVRDLDSHMWGPEEEMPFHVYYSNKRVNSANLDVDDTSYFGPETITVDQKKSGKYSYYVHDYTNRGNSNSNNLSTSDAYVELYFGNELLYTIHVPENNVGTVWHVFDIDGETGQVILVNEFSNENNPSRVGNPLEIASYSETSIPLKDYEIQE